MCTLNISLDVSAVNSIEDVTQEILSNFSDVFSDKLGEYKLNRICLQLKSDARPIFCRPRPVSLAYRKEVEEQLEKMQQDNLIEKIMTSPWATPVVPIRKTDGKLRLCGDYRLTLNPNLEPLKHPLPRIVEIFEKLRGGERYTKLDLSQAYHQFVLDDESQLLTTWSTSKGLFKWKRLPFGVQPGSAECQRRMEDLIRGLDGVANFLDDIFVTGKSLNDHISNLKVVLTKLREAGLTLKKEKCSFFEKEIQCLGYRISKEGLRKMEDKVNAIIRAKVPENLTEVRASLGLANYYSKFVPNMAQMLSPICKLLQKGTQFNWTKECQTALTKIREEIAKDVILTHFDPDNEIIVATDASNVGLGACLINKVGAEEKVVTFASRTLLPAEKSYPTIQLEALAIVFALKKFQHYLLGSEFIIRCDHKLVWRNKGFPCKTF